MNAHELMSYFNDNYGIDKPFPKEYYVDHETYANVCDFLFKRKRDDEYERIKDIWRITISVGPNSGVYFKNVELRLKE